MRILFLSHYFPPEVNAPASRLIEHARIWRELGHEVTVVTCAPNHPAGRLYPGYRNRLFQRENVEGLDVIRLWTWLAANEGFLPRIANYLSFFVSVMVWQWRFPKADIVVSTSPQFFCGLAGWLLRRKRRPWILEIRDLWPESIVAVGAMRKGAAIRLLERVEGWAYRKADLVVAVTDSFVTHIAARRGNAAIEVIKNGVDLAQFVPPAPQAVAAFRADHGLTGKFVASYVGTHGMAHGLDALLAAAGRLRGRDDIVFLLVGGGSERARLLAESDRLGLANVIMLDQLPKAMMPLVWGATDAALVLLKRLDTFKSVLPSKIFEAMALQCPIILGVEGEAQALVEAAEAGIAIVPEDDAALADAVARLADDRALGAAMGSSGRVFVEVEFDRRHLARRYLALMEALVASRR